MKFPITREGAPLGAFDIQTIRHLVAKHQLHGTDSAYCDGGWTTVAQLISSAGPEPKSQKEKFETLMGFLLILSALIGIGYWVKGYPERQARAERLRQFEAKQKEDHERRVKAYYVSVDFVKQSLKSPRGAEFSSYLLDDDTTGCVIFGEGMARAWGVVDAPNAFGVMLRERWEAHLQSTSNDGWKLISLQIGGNKLAASGK